MGHNLNEVEKQILEDYFYHIAGILKLSDWTFHFDWNWVDPDEREDEEYGAQIHCVGGRKHAIIRIGNDFRADSAEEQRHYVVHELIHCHFSPIDLVFREDLINFMQDDLTGYSALYLAHDRALEYAVDGLTDAICPHLPLIDWRD